MVVFVRRVPVDGFGVVIEPSFPWVLVMEGVLGTLDKCVEVRVVVGMVLVGEIGCWKSYL